jgi:hypothetical protein
VQAATGSPSPDAVPEKEFRASMTWSWRENSCFMDAFLEVLYWMHKRSRSGECEDIRVTFVNRGIVLLTYVVVQFMLTLMVIYVLT